MTARHCSPAAFGDRKAGPRDEPRALGRAGAAARGRAWRAGALKTVEAARDALEGGALPDLWPTAREAGWPGLLISEERGGAGLGAFDAMLVAQECGRVLAGVPLVGLLPATAILDAAGYDGLRRRGGRRAARDLAARAAAGDWTVSWTVDATRGKSRPPRAEGGRRRQRALTGTVAWVPDAPGADLLVVVATEDGGAGRGRSSRRRRRRDGRARDGLRPTRALAHVTLDGARARGSTPSADELGGRGT